MIFRLLPPSELILVCNFSNHLLKLSDDGLFTVVASCILDTKEGKREAYICKTSEKSMSNMMIVEKKGFFSYEGKPLSYYTLNGNKFAIVRKEYGTLLADNAASSAVLKKLGDD